MLFKISKPGWLRFAIYCATLLPLAGSAAAATPTAQELLATQDQETIGTMTTWHKQVFQLPDDLQLDPSLRQAANQIAQEHLARVRAAAPAWIAQARAASGNSGLLSRAQMEALYARSVNELAIWSVESGGPAQDDAWLNAALAPAACDMPGSPYFSRRIALIQTAPADSRAALLAGERELLSRWGSKRQHLPARPTAQELNAADHAIARMRAGQKIAAAPMPPGLAGRLFDLDRKPDQPSWAERWDKCAKSQWWLASQLASGKVDKITALNIYRYSTMIDAKDYVPEALVQNAAARRPGEAKPAYPPVAAFFGAEGSTIIETHADDQGRFLKAQVISRKITVPGVSDNAPIVFETLFDAAALDAAEKRHQNSPDNKPISQFELKWHLTEANK